MTPNMATVNISININGGLITTSMPLDEQGQLMNGESTNKEDHRVGGIDEREGSMSAGN